MNATALRFELDDKVIARPLRGVARPVVEAGEDSVTGVAGIVLWGELLDRLGLVGECDRRDLRPIGPGGYGGGACYRAVVETQLAGGDFLSDRSLLADEATQRLRGEHALASHTTLWRFCAGADLGRASKAAAVNRAMLARAWALGAAPAPGLLTIDPDATWISTYGPGKQGSAFSYKHEVGVSPMVGVCAETGDVLALRGRGGDANPGRAMGRFVDECVSAVPAGRRGDYQLWVRVDSAGYRADVVEAAERHNAAFTVTAKGYRNVRSTIEGLALDESTVWSPALGGCQGLGGGRDDVSLRRAGPAHDRAPSAHPGRGPVVLRRPRRVALPRHRHEHPADVRLRGRRRAPPPPPPRRRSRRSHPPAQGRLRPVPRAAGELLRELAVVAHRGAGLQRRPLGPGAGTAPGLRHLPGQAAAPRLLQRRRPVVRHAGRLVLRLPRAYAQADAFIAALTRLRRLPVFA